MKNVQICTLLVALGLVVSGCENTPKEVLQDLDGDGWTNNAEDDCGTASLDPNDIPTDTDGDLVCDAVDEDDDGDGVSDQAEIACGSDPQDYTSVPVDLDNDGYCSTIDADDNDPTVGLGDPANQDPVIPGSGPIIPDFPNPFPFPGGNPNPGSETGLEFDNQPEAPIPGGEAGLEFDNLPEAPIAGGEAGLEFDNLPQPPIPVGNVPILPGAEPVTPGGINGLEFD